MDVLICIGIIVSFMSFVMMISLHWRTTKLQRSIAKDSKHTLEFMVNLIINAAADPGTLRRLLVDYIKEMRWRAGVFCKDGKYNIGWEMPSPKEITIGDIRIAVIGLPEEGKNNQK